jgi:hypothetical protein
VRNLGQPMFVGVSNDLRNAWQASQFLGRTLGVAAGDNDPRSRIFAMDPPHRRPGILVCWRRDRAGIQDH